MVEEPLVLCLTNTVAANFTANVLLAIGAKPAMIEEPSEAAQLATVADAVLINVGTATPAQAATMRAALAACRGTDPKASPWGQTPMMGTDPTTGGKTMGTDPKGTPWVLDPVAVQALDYRRALVDEFLALGPTLIRGNQAEIDYLRKNRKELLGSVPILSTGAEDVIWVGNRAKRITGGVPLLQKVTATGCAQGAVCAAFLGWGQTPEDAAESASRLMKKAGEIAFGRAQGPGSFQMALLDALAELTHRDGSHI